MTKTTVTKRLYNALDWVQTHGWDFWGQFTREEWETATKATEIINEANWSGRKISRRAALLEALNG